MGAATNRSRPEIPAPVVHNEEVAGAFDEIADLLEIADESPFRVRAYRNAARVIRDLGREIGAIVGEGEDLTLLPGIGKDLAGKIRELVITGESTTLRELRERTPAALTTLLSLPGLGPKRVRALHDELGVETLDDVAESARAHEIREVPGFGERTEQRILEAIEAREGDRGRVRLAAAEAIAGPLIRYLKAISGVIEATVAGSFRRRKETVGDLDVVVAARDPEGVMDQVVVYGGIERVIAKGPTRCSVVLRSGLPLDVRVVLGEAYGAALHYFTGSKEHDIAVRRLGQERGLKINEYGVFRGEERIAGLTEESVFASVDLPWIPPELREDRGEIAAALEGRLPRLVEVRDLRGDLHAHSRATDGRDTVRAMAEAARARGLEYLAITEHSRRLTVARGLDPERLAREIEAIDQLADELLGITILKGIEVDILEDGRLDLPDEALAGLDLVVGSIHSRFKLSREAQTTRVLRAMDHRYFSILAHPTGRLIQEREPIDLDLERIVRHARQRGCFLEVNSQPARLDLPDVYARMAKEEGVKVAVSSDAHSVADLDHVRFGVDQARRGWLERGDVINTRPLAELRALLRSAR